EWSKRNGFESYRDDVGNFVAEKGDGNKILLLGHVDTVPGEIPVEIKEDVLYGRGVVDAKGSLACFLEATKNIDDVGIRIVGAVEEEGDSRGGKHVVETYDKPDYVVVGEPSGWSNVTIGYKGCINLTFRVKTKKRHSSNSKINSNEKIIDFYNQLKSFCEDFNQDKSSFNGIQTKVLSLKSDDDPFVQKANIKINVRFPPKFNIIDFKKTVEKFGKHGQIFFSKYLEAVKVKRSNKLVTNFLKSIRKNGGNVKFKLKTGTSDMNILKKYGVPMVAYGPGDSSLDHTPNEHLDLEEFNKSVRILKDMLKRL
ncbi:MAG: [LysW]-lysine hydrolase, partial [Candidatus Thermoplasmatota archaeon]